ncbi:hypothetical protein PYK79_29365 [Streptomyces sp. ID05-04B]|uniref:hypothetical protein n=1 Tax=unclassified Streptomyces TaxID=2593676 RepID=UPI000D1A32EB|nr:MULTISPECIES: hypothetical protein [unclassified Streptomyces]AVV42454.1 hypothetical protein C6376_14525 [Streptomyces sp. P3]MDX5566568.1 hypothetical protein [Streptomyces sp. ID05-04B]
MRRGLVHVLAWSLATGAAVTLSWWGVHTVMAGTAYDPPRALPLVADSAVREPKTPAASATGPGSSAAPSAGPSRSPGRTPAAPTPSSSTPAGGPAPSGPGASGAARNSVRSYDTDGGRVVFDLGRTSATLVSATPGAAWSMQVWKTESWIRVEFSSGADRVSVFCTWHDGPPRVEVGTY